jgi:transposase
VLGAAAQPLESKNWLAAVAVTTTAATAAGGRVDLARVAGLGSATFVDAVRAELPRWDASRVNGRILGRVFDALSDQTGVAAQRPGVLERVALLMQDWADARCKLADTETRMVGVLDGLELTELLTSIAGLSPICAAVILAETGDPGRFHSPRALVKHAGINPQQNTSGTLNGRSRITKRGRPGLRTEAWRAVWAALQSNTVLADKYQHLTTREKNPLATLQAHIACAAALLRWIHVVVTHHVPWNPDIAAGTTSHEAPRAA